MNPLIFTFVVIIALIFGSGVLYYSVLPEVMKREDYDANKKRKAALIIRILIIFAFIAAVVNLAITIIVLIF